MKLLPLKLLQSLGAELHHVDVLKLPQIIFQGSDLIIKTKLNHIKEELDKKNPAALIVEIPSNPLLQCVDLISISKLAKEKNIPKIFYFWIC